MGTKKILRAPVWPHWGVSLLMLALFSEYLRLVLTTDTPTYRIAVTAVLGAGFIVSLIRLLKTIRDSGQSTGSQ